VAETVQFAPGREAQFTDWLHHELTTALSARQPLEQQWVKWLRMYNAPVSQTLKQFPWEGAAAETIPAIATDVDQIYAKFMQTLHAAPNLWSVSALNERWVHVAKPMQDFLGLLDNQVLRMFNVNKRALLEMCKLGTAIYKTGWTYERRRMRMYDTHGVVQSVIKTRSIPFVDHVRLADFVLPTTAYNLDPDAQGGAPWIAERMRVLPDRLRMLAKATEPDLPNLRDEDVERVIRYVEQGLTPYDTAVQTQQYVRKFANETQEPTTGSEVLVGAGSTTRMQQIELWEVHVRYPAQGDEVVDDLVVLWHHPTRSIVRATLNPYHHGQRPYEVVRYFPGEGFYGIGIAEQKEVFQRVLSNLTNYATDNALLSNAIMLGAKAGANILPGEGLWPGKVLITDGDPRVELFPIQLGRPNSSMQMLLTLFQQYGERRTGVSDIQLGNMSDLPGRTPATTMVSMLQEGNRRPDLTIKDMRHEGLSRVGLRVIELIQQYLTDPVDKGQGALLQVMTDALGMPEGQLLADQMLLPTDPASLGLGVTITASSGSANKEVDKQNTLALLQLAAQVSPQILQFTQVAVQNAGNPIGQVAMGAAKGIVELYRRALEQHDVRDPESIVPSDGTNGPPAPPLPGPGGIPPGPAGAPGMGALPEGIGGVGGPASVPPLVGGA
jgi:hypothetical protein